MNFRFLVAALAAATVLYSCSKSSGNTSSQTGNSTLAGKWNIVSYVERVTQPNGTILLDSTPAAHTDNCTFTSNGNFYDQSWYDFTINDNGGTYSGYASTTDQDYSTDTAVYVLSGQLLYLTNATEMDTAHIVTLTANQLVIYSTSYGPTDQSWVYMKR